MRFFFRILLVQFFGFFYVINLEDPIIINRIFGDPFKVIRDPKAEKRCGKSVYSRGMHATVRRQEPSAFHETRSARLVGLRVVQIDDRRPYFHGQRIFATEVTAN